MKSLLLSLPLLLFITACTPTHRNSEWLKQAEEQHEARHPDSVLTYLYKINENQLTEEENRIFLRIKFATLLQTEPEALEQMTELANYYQQKKDTIHLQTMQSILYRHYSFGGKYAQADSILNIMHQTYLHQKDTNGIARIYAMKANLHESAGKTDSALYYLDKRIKAEANNSSRKHHYYRKAQLFLKKQAYTDAESMLDSAKAVAHEEADDDFLYHLTTYYQQLYTEQKLFGKAMQTLKESRKYMKRKDVASHNMYKAHTFELMHREDSARHYYEVVAKSENLFLATEAIYHLSRLAEAEDNPEKAYLHHQDATGYIDQVYRAYQSQAKNNAFNELKWQSEIDGLKISRQRHIILILSLVFALSVLSAGAIIYLQRKKQKLMAQENQLLRQAEELSQLREKAATLREELIRRMDAFKKVPSLQEEGTDEDHPISLTKEDWKEIKALLDNQYDHFTDRLKEAVPALNASDIQFCCLLKVNVSIQDIANIYHINKESVSRRKQRIKAKFGNELLNGSTLDEFIQRF